MHYLPACFYAVAKHAWTILTANADPMIDYITSVIVPYSLFVYWPAINQLPWTLVLVYNKKMEISLFIPKCNF